MFATLFSSAGVALEMMLRPSNDHVMPTQEEIYRRGVLLEVRFEASGKSVFWLKQGSFGSFQAILGRFMSF